MKVRLGKPAPAHTPWEEQPSFSLLPGMLAVHLPTARGFLSLLELGWQGSQQVPSARTGTFRELRFFLTVPL